MFNSRLLAIAAALSVAAVSVAHADDSVAIAKYNQARELYAQRADLTKVAEAVTILDEVLATAQDAELKYKALNLKSRCKYTQGMALPTTPKEPALAVFEAGYAAAKQAYTFNPAYADAYYNYAINLGRWALVKGKLASLSRKAELMDHLDKAIARATLAGDDGETFDGYGPHRTYGKLYKELPGFAGGDHTLSIRHLKLAFENAPSLALNSVYYAESLLDGNSAEEKLACEVLTKLLKFEATPEALDPDRIPETKAELKEARELFDEEC